MDHPTRRMNSDEVPDVQVPHPNDPFDPNRVPPRSCLRCGGVTVWAKTGVSIDKWVRPRLLGDYLRDTVALVCTSCGYTELYTYEAHKLLE